MTGAIWPEQLVTREEVLSKASTDRWHAVILPDGVQLVCQREADGGCGRVMATLRTYQGIMASTTLLELASIIRRHQINHHPEEAEHA
jgi:hypothetical protein